jgi:hypothetical protein
MSISSSKLALKLILLAFRNRIVYLRYYLKQAEVKTIKVHL